MHPSADGPIGYKILNKFWPIAALPYKQFKHKSWSKIRRRHSWLEQKSDSMRIGNFFDRELEKQLAAFHLKTC